MPHPRWQHLLSTLTLAGLLVGPITPTFATQPPAVKLAAVTPAQLVTTAPNAHKPDQAQWAAPGFKTPDSLRQTNLQQSLQPATLTPDLLANFTAKGAEKVMVIFQLADAPAALYTGGVAGLASTAADDAAGAQFDALAPATQAYMAYLQNRQAEFTTALTSLSPEAQVLAHYVAALNGVAVQLPGADVAKVAALPGVQHVYENTLQRLHTDIGPTWIGAPSVWTALGGQGSAGTNVIVGMIDSGIWSPNPLSATLGYTAPNPSFVSNASAFGGAYALPFTSVTGRIYTNTLGVCAPTGAQPSDGTFVCNNKVIGGYWYNATNLANAGEAHSPLDEDGHGSHTASIAAGNRVTVTNPAVVISGVAPRARLISYKICWNGDPDNLEDSFCGTIDTLSAVDQAIMDGVHALNYSIGGGTEPVADPVAQAFRSARAAGIFVSVSASNDGPFYGTVEHVSPWLNTSGAMEHNRTFRASLTLIATNTVTMPTNLKGASIRGTVTGRIILAPTQASDNGLFPSLCAEPYAANTFPANAIVVCRRGLVARVEKAYNVIAGGAAGFVLVNAVPDQGQALDVYGVPGVHLEYNATSYSDAGEDMVDYLLAMTSANIPVTATIGAAITATKQGDIMAAFSSRGPSGINLIKPDDVAPGVQILAATSPRVWDNGITDGQYQGFNDGTSMSSPHTVGAAALLKALRPNWNPAQIQAALMTGADPILEEDGATPTIPYDDGAGRLNLTRSMMPGLTFNVTTAEYTEYHDGVRAVETLNIPSLAQMSCLVSCAWTRVGVNVYTATSTYTWTVVSATPGLNVTLNQASYTVGAGQNMTFTVTANASGLASGDWGFARILLRDSVSGARVSLPLAITKVDAIVDAETFVITPRNTGGVDIHGQSGVAFANTIASLYGAAAPVTNLGSALGGDDQNWDTNPLDPSAGWYMQEGIWPDNLGRWVVTIGNSIVQDIDLAILLDLDDDGRFTWPDEVIGYSAGGTDNETVDFLNLQAYAGGHYMIAVYNWSGESETNFDVNIWEALPSTGDLTLVNLPTNLSAGQFFTPTLRFNKDMAEGVFYYGLVNMGTSSGAEDAIGTTAVNIKRTANEVQKSVEPSVVNVGQVVTYTILVQNTDPATRTYVLTDVLPAGLTYVPGSLTGPATYNSGLNAVLISTTLAAQVQSADYAYEDSLMVPNLIDRTPFGGYYDLETALGSPPTPFGDNAAGFFDVLGCNINYYDTTQGSATAIGMSSNGLFFPRSSSTNNTMIGGNAVTPFSTTLPSVITPNTFIAAYWDNLVMTPTAGITKSGYLAGTSGNCPNRQSIIQVYNAYKSGAPSQQLNYQLQFDTAHPGEFWVLYGNISGTLASGSVGLENLVGDKGLQYAYAGNPANHVLASGRVIHYYRPMLPAPPITVTFRVTVTNPLVGLVWNNVNYTVNAPHTAAMTSQALLRVSGVAASAQGYAFPTTNLINNKSYLTATVRDWIGSQLPDQPMTFAVSPSTNITLYPLHPSVAKLAGINEVPGNTSFGNGVITFTYNASTRMLSYVGAVQALSGTITAAHIHTGTAGTTGSVLYPLNITTGSTNGTLSGSVGPLSDASILALYSGGLYANVHTSSFGGGEVRGQLYLYTNIDGEVGLGFSSSIVQTINVTVASGPFQDTQPLNFIVYKVFGPFLRKGN